MHNVYNAHTVHKGHDICHDGSCLTCAKCGICDKKLEKDELKTIKISNFNRSMHYYIANAFPALGKCKKCRDYERKKKQYQQKKLLKEVEKNKLLDTLRKEKIHKLLKKRSCESGCMHLHATCDLRHTGGCCVCKDKRPFTYNYTIYIDGQGDQYTTKRPIGYCPICRVDRERLEDIAL